MFKLSTNILKFGYKLKGPVFDKSTNMFVINKAKHPGKLFCLKVFDKEYNNYGGVLKEFNFPKKINSPLVVKNYHLVSDKHNFYIISKLYNYDLIYLLNSAPIIDEHDVKYFVKKIIEPVSICHKNNIAHLDLKPCNYITEIVDNKLNLILTDFGHAEFVVNNQLTKTNNIKGTENYIAPELRNGYFSLASDIYSIGKITEQFLNLVKSETTENSMNFVNKCIQDDIKNRATIADIANDSWLK